MNITSFAISGQCSSGKSTLSLLLAKQLGWNYVNFGEVFKRLAIKYKLLIEKFGLISDTILRSVDIKNKERIKTEYNFVWDSSAR